MKVIQTYDDFAIIVNQTREDKGVWVEGLGEPVFSPRHLSVLFPHSHFSDTQGRDLRNLLVSPPATVCVSWPFLARTVIDSLIPYLKARWTFSRQKWGQRLSDGTLV